MKNNYATLSWTAVISFLLVGGSSVSLHAQIIPGLFGTGVSATGALLGDGSVDPHYSVVSFPTGSPYNSSNFVVNSGYPIGPGAWFENGPNSKWIGPAANMHVASPPGSYVYETTFDLTGYDSSKVLLNGKWSTDNFGLDIRINGHSTGITYSDGPGLHLLGVQ